MTQPAAGSVSVVIPTYNRADLLPLTLRSVLAQTHPPAEVVIVDDGSTDGTAEACRELPPSVRYVRQPNAGVSAARNHGARLVQGEWLAFVDSDDLWHPDKLRVQLAALAAHPEAAWSFTGCDVIDLAGAPMPGRRGFRGVFAVFHEPEVAPETFFRRHFEGGTIALDGATYPVFWGDPWPALFLGNFVLPSSALIRREAFNRAGGFDPAWRLAEETEFFHRLSAANPAVVVADAMVLYRAGQDGSLVSPANITKLMENALASLDRALALRGDPGPAARQSYRLGRRRLLRRLAYARLTQRDGPATRAALARYWTAESRDAWSLGVWTASWLPPSLLGGLHAGKRWLAAARR